MKFFYPKYFIVILVSVLLVSVSQIANANWNAEVIVINFPTDSNPNSPVKAAAVKFEQLVSLRLDPNIVQAKTYDLGNKDPFEELELGNAQIIAPPLSLLKRYSDRMQVFELPFLFYSAEAAEEFSDGEWGKRLLESLSLSGIEAHGYLHRGMKNLTSDELILNPDDLIDKKLGIFNSNTAEKHYEVLGVNTVNLTVQAGASALDNNLVDALENNWVNIYNQSIHNKQQFILESRHAYTGNVMFTTEKMWDAIPEELQVVLEQIIEDSIKHGNEVAKQLNNRYRNLIANSQSNTVNQLTVDQRNQWVEASRKVWTAYENQIGTQLINAAASHL